MIIIMFIEIQRKDTLKILDSNYIIVYMSKEGLMESKHSKVFVLSRRKVLIFLDFRP